MTRGQLLQRISIDPNVCFGKPCVRGTRLWVSPILDLLASGMSEAEVIDRRIPPTGAGRYPSGDRLWRRNGPRALR